MQNMKKILGALTALSFVSVAGVSTVACNSCSPNKDDKKGLMDSTVLLDLQLYDKDGKSRVQAKINTGATASWSSDQLNNIKASGLLDTKDKAKSENSFKFLTGILKLEANGDGAWNQKTFDKSKADAVVLSVKSIDPTLKPITGDFAISGGTAKVQWKQNTTNLGGEYSINLKADESKGVVKGVLPASKDIKLTDFDTTKGVLEGFVIDKPKGGITIGSVITKSLKVDSGKGQEIANLSKLIKQPYELIITGINAPGSGNDFAAGDSLIVKISLGSVQIATEYELTL